MPTEHLDMTTAPRWLGHASFLLALVACGDRTPTAAPTPAKVVPTVVAPVAAPPVSAPHSGRIQLVATTDRGDAAISLDNQGALRLWPALDGTYEPVVVHASAAKELALSRDGKELVAAILDDAGGVELLRFDGAGGLFGRVKLPVEPRIDEVVLVGGFAIAKRDDESLARFDSRGTPRGVLMPEPGQRVISLDARRGGVIVGLGTESATSVRFVTDAFAWGKSFALPEPLVGIALAPGHTRVIGFTARFAKVIQLGAVPSTLFSFVPAHQPVFLRKHGGPAPAPPPPTGGFLDDDHVLVTGPDFKWASAASPEWVIVERESFDVGSHAAIGDVAVAGTDAGLVISGIHGEQHLGYRKLGREFELAGSHVLAYGNREVFWLDDELRATRVTKSSELYDGAGPEPQVLFALDDTHLLFARSVDHEWKSKQQIMLYDLTTKTSTEVAVLPRSHSYPAYDRETGVIAFRVDKLVHRFRLDIAAKTATPLRPLGDGDDLLPITLTDPAKANGVAAIVAPPQRGFVRVYFDEPGTGPLQPRKVAVAKVGQVVAIDRLANVYVSTLDGILAYHVSDKTPPARIPIRNGWLGTADDQTLALTTTNGVTVYERDGTERWHALVDRPREYAMRGKQLLVDADSGLVAFDLRTGARLMAACGWGFGLYDKPETSPAPNVPSACADDR